MISITDKFITGLHDLTRVEIPKTAILQAKKCLIDYLGVTFAGAKLLKEKGNALLEYSDTSGGRVPVIGFGKKSNIYNAALINGMSAHVAELDDGYRQGSIHPGAPIISALFPIAQQFNLSGENFLKGIIVGYEAAIRLAHSMQPSHRNKGYHATGTCGTIGVSLGIGAALSFTQDQMKNAFSAAAASASGMLNIIKGESELKPYNSGHAAVSGIIAATTALSGFFGPFDILPGKWGFIEMMTEKINLSLLENMSDGKLGIEKVYFKPYAACRHSHPAIEGALEIKKKFDIKPDQIAEIVIYTYQLAAEGHDHTEINGITDAKMSTPFSVAVALIIGRAGINEYSDEMISNISILNLANKIRVLKDNDLNALVPEKRPAIVNIITYDNKEYSIQVDLAKGEPENPLTDAEIDDKFYSLSSFGNKNDHESRQISQLVWNIEDKMSEIFHWL